MMYAVIFTSKRSPLDSQGYEKMSQLMVTLAQQEPGFIKINSARNDVGITVSYWENKDAIVRWKANLDHLDAQRKGKKSWYAWYDVEVCKVERAYSFRK